MVTTLRILRAADIADNRTGGMARAMYSTGDALCRMGHEVEYLFRPQLDARGPDSLRRFTVPLRIPQIVRERARQGRRYDLVEIHEPLGAAYCVQRRRGASLPPVVLYSHGLEERGHRATLAYRKQKGLPISLKQRYSPLSVVWQARYGLRNCSHVVCCSQEDVEFLKRSGIPENRLTCMGTGVESELLVAGAGPVRQDGEQSGILFAGTWLLRKGILDLVPAIEQVLRDNPHTRFTAAGVGVNPAEVYKCFATKFHSRLTVIPHFSGQELAELFRRHSIFVLPSYFEGQPIVMTEAAAMGLAIVTTNTCGMRDFVKDGVTGKLVPVGDRDALTDCLQMLVRDKLLAIRFGEAARCKAQTRSWQHCANDLEAAYRQALDFPIPESNEQFLANR